MIFCVTFWCGSSPRVWGTVKNGIVVSFIIRFIPACVGNSRVGAARNCNCPVHPRVCWEQSIGPRLAGCRLGSSPRVWGTGVSMHTHRLGCRFIPACVGNSHFGAFCLLQFSVHPRVCGEQECQTVARCDHNGSSPRVWGTVWPLWQNRPWGRFIPACVGNSAPIRHHTPTQTVHPRVCGEQRYSRAGGVLLPGSSPRVWGTVALHGVKP